MQKQISQLTSVFPDRTFSMVNSSGFKMHVKEINGEQIRVLSDVSQTCHLSLKRSGTGITIIVKEK